MTIESDVERIRVMIGDNTEEADQILSDEEIESFIEYRKVEHEDGLVTNLPAAAADCAGAIAAKFARKFNFAEDGQRFDLAQQHGHYLALEETLRRRAGGTAVY